MENVTSEVRSFILREFLPGENPELLADSTPLLTGGILDSIATLKLVSFLEEQFSIELAPEEVGSDYINTVSDIARLVQSKLQ
jgi:acyl carrier protein